MTREEAIEHGKEQLEIFGGEHKEFIKVALKALEQEPCEDAISRQAYIERFRKWGYSEFGRKMDNEALAIRVAMSLPPVDPQEPKTGHWVKTKAENVYGWPIYECSECKTWLSDTKPSNFKFCFGCGAKMGSEG